MTILDIDLDYFLMCIFNGIPEDTIERIKEEKEGELVWGDRWVRQFIENNLRLSKFNKIKGRIVKGHNEALLFWKELMAKGLLQKPFEVIHIDSHADLGLDFYGGLEYITNKLLGYDVEERPKHNVYFNKERRRAEGIGDYLLFAIAYRWISKLTYCANPIGTKDDYPWSIVKENRERIETEGVVKNMIQLLYNPNEELPYFNDIEARKLYMEHSKKEPEVPFYIIPTVEGVQYDGKFDFVVLAQSPNYTPVSADGILDIFKEYIDEI